MGEQRGDLLIDELAELKNEIFRLKAIENDYKRLQGELDEQRRLYMDLANTSPAGIYRVRVTSKGQSEEQAWTGSGDPPYFFDFFNDQFCRICNVANCVPQSNPDILLDSIFDDDKAEWARINIKANKELTKFLWEGRLCINGKIKWVHFESLPRRLENNDIIWTGILYDITERKNRELIIKDHVEKLAQMNTEKDKFYSIIAHDLKGPLNAIVGFSNILTEQVREKNLPEISKYSEIIASASQNASNLLMNLIEWALSQSGVILYEPQHFDMLDTIEDILFTLSDMAKQKSIRLNQTLPAALPVFADVSMISTILRNLISNAIKFTEPGGEVSIVVERSPKNLTVFIKDTGIGMSEEVIQNIFILGENRSTLGTGNERGTGLGLILCKDFVRRHNGDIQVISALKEGTTFYFTLPL